MQLDSDITTAAEAGAMQFSDAELSVYGIFELQELERILRAPNSPMNAAVELARIDLANTQIHAPEDGRLGQVSARLGQYVTAGTALAPLVGQDIWIVANFPETGVNGMKLGQAVDITVDALQDRHFTGRVESFSPATASEFSLLAGSNATGNFTKIVQRLPVRISIDPGQEMGEYLAPGLSVIVRVDTGSA